MKLENIFPKKKPVIGMVHLCDLYSLKGIGYVTERALADAYNLHLGGYGVDGLLVENWEERSGNPFVTDETAERMLQVTKTIRNEIKAPVGVNVLHNDYRAAFRIARELDLPFVQLDVYVDRVRTDFEHTQVQFDVCVDIEDVKKHRPAGAALFVNIHPKHYKLLEEKAIEMSARQAIDNGADAVVVTKLTGQAPDAEILERVKNFTESYRNGFSVFQGSGCNKYNAPELAPYFHGVIIGTALKIDEITDNPVDPRRVEEFMEIYETARHL